MTRPSCAESSRGASIIGSAPTENAYLIVELAKPWPSKIKKADGVVVELQKRIKKSDVKVLATPRIDWLPLSSTPWALLVRWDGRQARTVALPAETQEIQNNLDGPVTGDPLPLYLVCTHGSRDRCCGTLGVPVYRSLKENGQRKVLQVSHLGGHRYAPVVAVLPEWRFYGHLDPTSVLELDATLSEGGVYQSGYRGLGRLREYEQAVEAKIWAEHGSELTELTDWSSDRVTRTVTVKALLRGGLRRSYTARLGSQTLSGFKSCEDALDGKSKVIELPTVLSLEEQPIN